MDLTENGFMNEIIRVEYGESSASDILEILKDNGVVFKKEEFEIGKWYKSTPNGLSLIFNQHGSSGYGFWGHRWGMYCSLSPAAGKFVLATDEEVETALIKEAKKRGFKEGVKVVDLCLGKLTVTLDNTQFVFQDDEILASNNSLTYATIFSQGKWATIIEETIEETKEVTIEEIQKELGYKIKIVE